MNTLGNTLLSRDLRLEMWQVLLARLCDGETLYSSAQFRDAMLEIYEQVTGEVPTAPVEDDVGAMVDSVNREHPDKYLALSVQNGITKAFEEGVRRHNWDVAKIQENGIRVMRRFSQQEPVRDLFEGAKIDLSRFSMVRCVTRVIDQVALQQETPSRAAPEPAPAFRPDPAPVAPAAPVPAVEDPVDVDTQEAIASGEVDAEVARERAAEGERRRAVLEEQEYEKIPERLDAMVHNGVVTEEEAGQLHELRRIDGRVNSGEITEKKAAEIRNSLMNSNVREKLEGKVRESVADSVRYLQVFESMKKIDSKYHDALCFLIQHKNLVTAGDNTDIDQGAAIKALMEDVDLLDDLTDIMERKDQELRMISVRLHPYSGIMKRGIERMTNMTIEEVFVEDLVKVDVVEMSDRLASDDPQLRVRPAADMLCLINLIDHVTKRTRFRKELRLLRIARQVEQFYHSTSDMNEARHQAENFLSRRLRRMFPDMNSDEAAELQQRSNEMMDQIEQRIHEERRAKAEAEKATTAETDGGGTGDNLSEEDVRKGVQIGRVEMRVAGNMRRIPTRIMPDPDDPTRMVIVSRDPKTQELIPAVRRGAKRVVERNRDGYWAEVR